VVVIAARIPKDLKEQVLAVCKDIYEIETVSGCIKEILRDVVYAYRRLKPTRESLQRTLIEILRKK